MFMFTYVSLQDLCVSGVAVGSAAASGGAPRSASPEGREVK